MRVLKAFKGFTESTGGVKVGQQPKQKQLGEHMILDEIHESVKDPQEQLKLIREHHTNKGSLYK